MTRHRCCTPVALAGLAILMALPAVARGQQEPAPIPAGQPPLPGAYSPAFDALHYAIDITLPAQGAHINATATIDIALRQPADTLALDLTGLAVDSVLAGRAGGAPLSRSTFRQADGRLYVPVPAGVQAGDTLRVVVAYEGTPDDGLTIGVNEEGRRSVFADNWPNRARFWIPSFDHPSDKATVRWTVHAPKDWEVVANGERVDSAGDKITPDAPAPADGVWRWRLDVPIPVYTMVIGATDFAIGTVTPCAKGGVTPLRPDGCVPVEYWVYPDDSAYAAVVFKHAGDIVAYYTSLIAPYAYEKLAHVESATRFGGMENVGAIFYDQRAMEARRDIGNTVAHETAHQWFGDGVTEKDWQELWLSEGFATYFASLWAEHAQGEPSFRQSMERAKQQYLHSDVVGRPIVGPLQPGENLFWLLNANSYEKGAWVLHMLRGMLGDSTFFDGLRRYYDAHRYGTATTADLRHALEQASGKDLQWFFKQWVYEPGYPQLRVSRQWNADSSVVLLKVAQVQPASWPAFRAPVTLAFSTPAGVVRRSGWLDGRHTTLRFKLPAEPTAVTLDPDGWLLHTMAGPQAASPPAG
jgi:aminopeptidase N